LCWELPDWFKEEMERFNGANICQARLSPMVRGWKAPLVEVRHVIGDDFPELEFGVERNPWVYIFNFVPFFFIVIVSLSSLRIDAFETQSRLSVTVTALLTAVVYKSSLLGNLPVFGCASFGLVYLAWFVSRECSGVGKCGRLH